MSWRTVVLTKDAKLSLRMNHLVVSNEEVTKIPLGEISTVIIENPNIVLTGHLMNALTNHQVMTFICDQQYNPATLLQPMYGHHRQSRKIKQQFNWTSNRKGELWKEIVQQKIHNQKEIAKKFSYDERISLFSVYKEEVDLHDRSNREGHAAKVYFNVMFGQEFHRDQDVPINWALNYGYSVLCSLFARVIVSKGYLTEIGIHHINEFNLFNLASDLMEVYRPLVDRIVKGELEESKLFGKEERRTILSIFDKKVVVQGKMFTLNHSIQMYVESCFDFMNGEQKKQILFPTYT